MLSVHYRHPINYSEEVLENVKASLERLRTSYQNLKHRLQVSDGLTENNDVWLEKLNDLHEQFIKEMDDDFNTANAISMLFELSKQANYYLMEKNTDTEVINAFLDKFNTLFSVLGLSLEEEGLLDEEIEGLIQQRIQARKDRNFGLSDEIRDRLKNMNIILEDTPQGTRWKRG
jgi:cysteinyl-tRNA synthetase